MPRVNVKDKRKQQLMEANIASIARRGLEGTTIAHVSKGAGMSRGIVNFYFASKEKMMQETIAHLCEEYTQCWQEALSEARKKSNDPLALIEVIVTALMGNRHCTQKRLAVWAAFLGGASTHAGYAKSICSADEMLVRQLKDLWQKAGLEAKMAEQRARQIQAFLRGHYLLCALGLGERRPSAYLAEWLHLLQENGSKLKTASMTKPKKPLSVALPGQLDFGDLFAQH